MSSLWEIRCFAKCFRHYSALSKKRCLWTLRAFLFLLKLLFWNQLCSCKNLYNDPSVTSARIYKEIISRVPVPFSFWIPYMPALPASFDRIVEFERLLWRSANLFCNPAVHLIPIWSASRLSWAGLLAENSCTPKSVYTENLIFDRVS